MSLKHILGNLPVIRVLGFMIAPPRKDESDDEDDREVFSYAWGMRPCKDHGRT